MHSDADVGGQGVEDDPGGWLWKEIRRFLRHHLARARDLDHVRDRGRAQEEGRLAGSRFKISRWRTDTSRRETGSAGSVGAMSTVRHPPPCPPPEGAG